MSDSISRPETGPGHSRVRLRNGALLAIGLITLALGLVPEALWGQGPAAANPQMRHFWHVFAAYAIVWALVFGWVVSITRRLKRIEERLDS